MCHLYVWFGFATNSCTRKLSICKWLLLFVTNAHFIILFRLKHFAKICIVSKFNIVLVYIMMAVIIPNDRAVHIYTMPFGVSFQFAFQRTFSIWFLFFRLLLLLLLIWIGSMFEWPESFFKLFVYTMKDR